MSSPTFVAATSTSFTTATSVVASVPAGTSDDDAIIALLTVNSLLRPATTPVGWTLLRTVSGASAMRTYVYYRIASSEPASYEFSWGGGTTQGVVHLLSYSGADMVDPVNASGGDDGTANLATSPSIVTDTPDCTVVSYHAMQGAFAGLSSPSGVTLRSNRDGGNVSSKAFEFVQEPAGSTPTVSSTADNPSEWTTAQVALAPANVPPNAPVLDDPGVINRNVTNRLSWTFSDDDPGDSQSEFTIEIREQGDTVLDVDVTTETTNTYYDLPGGTLAAGDFEFRVRTRDALGDQGPFSAWEPFEAADPPAGPTVTAPINDGTISTEESTVEWSAASQDAYQLRRLGDNGGSPDTDTVLFDTGQVNSSGARSRVVEFPTNDQTEHVQVRVLRNSLWSPYSTVRVDVDYTVPETPTAVLDVDTPDGAITVSATNPTPGAGVPDVESLRVFRRLVGDDGDGIRLAINVPPSGEFVDWTVASGVAYEYRVQAMGDNGTSSLSAWVS